MNSQLALAIVASFFAYSPAVPTVVFGDCTGCVGSTENGPGGGSGNCASSLTLTTVVTNGTCADDSQGGCEVQKKCSAVYNFSWSSDCDGSITAELGGIFGDSSGAKTTLTHDVKKGDNQAGLGTIPKLLNCGGTDNSYTIKIVLKDGSGNVLQHDSTSGECSGCPDE